MTDGDLGNSHISFSEMWGLPKGRITGNPEVISSPVGLGTGKRAWGRSIVTPPKPTSGD